MPTKKPAKSRAKMDRATDLQENITPKDYQVKLKKPLRVIDVAQRVAIIADKVGGKAELARRIGVPAQRLTKYTRQEKPQAPGLQILQKITLATGCSADWLLLGRGNIFPADPEDRNTAKIGLAVVAGKLADALDYARGVLGMGDPPPGN